MVRGTINLRGSREGASSKKTGTHSPSDEIRDLDPCFSGFQCTPSPLCLPNVLCTDLRGAGATRSSECSSMRQQRRCKGGGCACVCVGVGGGYCFSKTNLAHTRRRTAARREAPSVGRWAKGTFFREVRKKTEKFTSKKIKKVFFMDFFLTFSKKKSEL